MKKESGDKKPETGKYLSINEKNTRDNRKK